MAMTKKINERFFTRPVVTRCAWATNFQFSKSNKGNSFSRTATKVTKKHRYVTQLETQLSWSICWNQTLSISLEGIYCRMLSFKLVCDLTHIPKKLLPNSRNLGKTCKVDLQPTNPTELSHEKKNLDTFHESSCLVILLSWFMKSFL